MKTERVTLRASATKRMREQAKRHPNTVVVRRGLFDGVESVLVRADDAWLGWWPLAAVVISTD